MCAEKLDIYISVGANSFDFTFIRNNDTIIHNATRVDYVRRCSYDIKPDTAEYG